MLALDRQNNIKYLTTLSIINAIMQVGNGIIAATTGSAGTNSDNLSKTLDELKKLFFPRLEGDKANRAAEVKRILEKEVAGGPLKIRPLDHKRARRRRK